MISIVGHAYVMTQIGKETNLTLVDFIGILQDVAMVVI